jgi:hypothetical protein
VHHHLNLLDHDGIQQEFCLDTSQVRGSVIALANCSGVVIVAAAITAAKANRTTTSRVIMLDAVVVIAIIYFQQN